MSAPNSPAAGRLPTDRPLKFVAIGECMVEMAPAGEAGQFAMGFAGDTFNTIWYLKRLCPDWQAQYITRVGTDAVSDDMLAMMAEAGIDTGHVVQSADRSVGLYLISLMNGERSFSYWRDRSAARQLAADRADLDVALDGADLIYFSGITMAVLEGEGRSTLLAAIAQARANGATIAFDSNLRPRLWASTVDMCAAVMDAASVSDIVLPSYDDEVLYFGDTAPQDTLERYRKAGAGTVIVKNGEGSVLFAHGAESGSVTPQPAKDIRDTTAAGDSFNAGIFAGLAQTGDMRKAITLASDIAGQVIGQRGALVPVKQSAA